MQARYGCGDNYRAFNGNLGVSFSDVNRDVKSGSQFQIPPLLLGRRQSDSPYPRVNLWPIFGCFLLPPQFMKFMTDNTQT